MSASWKEGLGGGVCQCPKPSWPGWAFAIRGGRAYKGQAVWQATTTQFTVLRRFTVGLAGLERRSALGPEHCRLEGLSGPERPHRSF